MAAKRTKKANGKEPLGFEQKLWAAADKMRGHMDPAECKHVALGLVCRPKERISADGATAAMRSSAAGSMSSE